MCRLGSGGGNIKGDKMIAFLANTYRFVIIISAFISLILVVFSAIAFVNASEGLDVMKAAAFFGASFGAFLACGGIAILIDIMDNIRKQTIIQIRVAKRTMKRKTEP